MTKKLTPAQRARRQRKQERRWAFITQAASEFESRPEAERQRLTARRQRRDACALSWEEQRQAVAQRRAAKLEQRKAYRLQQETARAWRTAKLELRKQALRRRIRRMQRVVYQQNRHYGGGLRIFHSMPSGTRFSLGLMLPDGTVLPTRTPAGNIPVTRELCTPDDGSRRHARPRPRFKRPQR